MDGLEKRVRAFGEEKTVEAWAEDPRAAVWGEMIVERLDGGMAPEQAVGLPFGDRTPKRLGLVAWGEYRPLSDWARDPRAKATEAQIRVRSRLGWSAERAISEPPKKTEHEKIEIWGEWRSARGWVKDPRARTSDGTFLARIAKGWSAERALTTPSTLFRQGKIRAFGEVKSAPEWAKDARCSVSYSSINERIRRGLTPEEAITLPGKAERDLPTVEGPQAEAAAVGSGRIGAFGETKGMGAWARDGRCAVPRAVLEARLRAGWHPEDALTVAMGVAFDPLARAA